ncbi:MAG: hypothetical protein A2126_02450 [Candidatus Woykebacteria bacterium GWB1_45_5]|uniref:NTP pyrophosphohydrolase MazG putative catalytic core domain-containing protein n=2 Tax=Candidatus Woykeibacteriota TaxID=1817899 RepID=A0A1G1W1M9_9BACT|nr:MAG: hypothetical protein A2113_00185 [Candidatus Woykebacteria bacterium GWA1_44_8]OGY23683.1 MAG: hypothetical protein A2126_02450 [Candidatus Woykebacteria bacterium GWB1_45_5]
MVKILPSASLNEAQEAIQKIYGLPDDRLYSVWDLLSNQQRFAMRALKGIRQGDKRKVKLNLIISFCWILAIMNRLHINLEESVWQRFPYRCSYCGKCPCACKKNKVRKRIKFLPDGSKKPTSLTGLQNMFREIYPSSQRSLEHAGIHLAEELGELSESIHMFFGEHKESYFQKITVEATDFFSCIVGIANSANFDIAKELAHLFRNNCHVCHKAPCVCDFSLVAKFKS